MERHPEYRKICELASRLCDGRLDETSAAELQQLVTTDEAARDLYVRYLELHSHLHWDFGMAAGESTDISSSMAMSESADSMKSLLDELLTEASVQNAPALPREKTFSSRHKAAALLTSSLVVLLVAGTGWYWVTQRDQVDPPQNIAETSPQTDADSAKTNDDRSPGEDGMDLPAPPPELPSIDWAIAHNQPDPIAADSVEGHPGDRDNKPVGVAYSRDDDVIKAINTQVASGWEDWGFSPAPSADDFEWVRRVYLDLAGRIPTEAELQSFLADQSPDRDQQLVDRLLESPSFALHWSTNWMNLLVGRSPNPQVDRLTLQEYLYAVADRNGSWNRVVKDLIAAEGNPRENGAANFLVAHLNNQAVPATSYVARTLLGFQIQCAQCHQHPFYSVSQREFWELNSFFKQAVVTRVGSSGTSEMSQVELRDRQTGGPTYYESRDGVMHAAFPRYNGTEVDEDETVSRRQQLANLLVEGEDPLVAQAFVNRTWSQLFGYGFTQPVDDLGPHNPPSHPELFATLSRSFVSNDYDIKRLYRWICLSDAYRLSSRVSDVNREDAPDQGNPPAFTRMYFKPLSPEQLYDSLLAVAGHSNRAIRNRERHVENRDQWVQQFVSSYENDENNESSHFDGTISQALVLMNGSLVDETISPEKNPFLAELIQTSLTDQEKFERVCIKVLSRKPTQKEQALFRQVLASLRDVKSTPERNTLLARSLSDLLWAYVNSSEFITNH
ncbi:DUF1549 domain-containing protein [Rubinisphaera margarita]|uniref:DUF1549 domain-containing protein n=1 Tax=Rubinisphaera margarita TaxID=2909586 RepID=UPI001EE91233|nr:DUF1549 domain-containing protein [Rubinisphaera margarita]MCG6154344.1 DUF1549 and DUF1553 domain-containing protein [Rubinisphaera margarita]